MLLPLVVKQKNILFQGTGKGIAFWSFPVQFNNQQSYDLTQVLYHQLKIPLIYKESQKQKSKFLFVAKKL